MTQPRLKFCTQSTARPLKDLNKKQAEMRPESQEKMNFNGKKNTT